ncbi:hypothetical protein D0S48_18250 [Psychrobacillus sp. AK 1817]|nr:hypothetical protein D0S48_18250 [Psychrobacillus sp. AK 1817]
MEAKTSKTINFYEGINIITSKDNQLGKSTIMKSLYYCLGSEMFFSDRLNLKTKMHFLELEIKGKPYLFLRHGKIIVVKDRNGLHKFNSATELSHFLSEILELKVMLESKGKSYVIAPPVFTFLPYYIDQDYGWTPELKSFDNLNQFDKNKRKYYSYYHLSLLNEEFGEFQIQKKTLEIKIKELLLALQNATNLLEYINNTLTKFKKEIDLEFLRIEYENTLVKYKKYSFDLNNLRKNLIKINEEIYKIDNIINNLNESQKDHEKVIKNIKKNLEVECPNCQSIFEVQAKDVFRINYNISDLDSSKIELIDLKEKVLEKKQKVEKDYYSLNELLHKIENEKVKSEITFDEVLRFKGLEETQQKLTTEYLFNDAELKKEKKQLSRINKQLKSWNDSIDKANESYRDILEYNLHLFNTKENDLPSKIEIDHTISASGSGQVRVNLARIYSFLQLKENTSNSHIRLPLLIDSPKGGEQSVSNSELILSLITDKMELPNQIILATIDFDSFYRGDVKDFNLIVLDNPQYSLLNTQDYLSNEALIKQYFELYWLACK